MWSTPFEIITLHHNFVNLSKVDMKTFFKSANRKSRVHSAIANPQICLKYCITQSQNGPKNHVFKSFYFILRKSVKMFGFANRKYTNYKSANHKRDWVCRPKIPKVSHFRKVGESKPQICDLRNLFVDRPPLELI